MLRTVTHSKTHVPPMPANLLRTLAKSRTKGGKAIVALVSVSIALSIAASFTVTALTGTMVWNLQSRVTESGRGASMIRAAAVKAFLPWHVISLAAAVVASAAISCVLAVAFVGRKKSLGILKIMGGTTRDLRRLLWVEALYTVIFGFPPGMVLGAVAVTGWLGASAISLWCFAVSAGFAAATLAFGVWLPMRLVRNASCAQLLNNRPVYAFSNPSCAKCGLCGGF